MESLNEQLRTFITLRFKTGEIKHVAIAKVLTEAIYQGVIPLSSEFPSQTLLINFYKVSPTTIGKVWKLLLNVHQVIITHYKIATYVVDYLPEHTIEEQLWKRMLESDHHRIYMNQLVLHEPNADNGGVATQINKGYAFHMCRMADKNNRSVTNALNRAFCEMMSHNLDIPLRSRFAVHTYGHSYIIQTICEVILSGGKALLMVTPGSDEMLKGVKLANKKCMRLMQDNDEIDFSNLESILIQNKVGILYLSNTDPSPGVEWLSLQKLQILLELKEKYHFVLVIDDRFPAPTDAAKMKMIGNALKNCEVLYIRTFSRRDARLYEINLVTGEPQWTRQIDSRLANRGTLLDPPLAYTVLDILNDGSFYRNKFKVYQQTSGTYNKALEILAGTGVFDVKALGCLRNFFICLVPASGVWPEEIMELLEENRFIVFKLIRVAGSTNGRMGICISLPRVRGEKHLKEVLLELSLFLAPLANVLTLNQL